jgi:hypothetical protein
MALSSTDRARIRWYLGWTQRYLQTDSRLELAMGATDASADALLIIQDTLINGGLLASLADIDAKLVNAHKRIKVSKVGTIELPGKMEIGILRSEGRRFVARLASLLGVEVRNDVYSGNLPKMFAGYGGPYGGGGNLPPLG